MNKRLTSFLTENGIICDEQIGFRHGSRTSDHIFKLKTLISKYLHNSKKLYVSFIDLKKAFDSVLHPALFIKLVSCGLGGNFLSVLRAMYSQIDLQVICNSRGLTEVFPSQLGVFQGDNLSPNLFNIFVNDLTKCFDETCMPVLLGEHRINCLLYADDLIILSESASGLQNCLNVVGKFCSTWGLDINYNKSKVMVFSKSSKLFDFPFTINNIALECVREYKYLGIIFSLNGSFTKALNDLYHRGQKAFFKLTSLFKHAKCSAEQFLFLFDHTVKPVLMYGTEVVGFFNSNKLCKSKEKTLHDMYVSSPLEKLNIHMCKYVLGVGKRTSNIATYGELGRYPLYIDTVLAIIKYWLHINEDAESDKLIKDALQDNHVMFQNKKDCWLSCVYMILKECNLLRFFNNPQAMTRRHLTDLKKSLQSKFVKYWSVELHKSDKLRTYRKFKSIFMFEKYLTHVSNDSDRSNLARFRTSCHKLLIEYGRYTTPKTPIAERLCKQCVMNAVEDESHFLLVCPKYANHRIKITNHLNNNTNFESQSYMSKFQWLLSNEDESVCKDIASFVTICFSLRN